MEDAASGYYKLIVALLTNVVTFVITLCIVNFMCRELYKHLCLSKVGHLYFKESKKPTSIVVNCYKGRLVKTLKKRTTTDADKIC